MSETPTDLLAKLEDAECGSRELPVAGETFRSQGYSMFTEYVLDEAGDPTIAVWRFSAEDDPCDGEGWLEVTIHEIVTTQNSGKLVVYYRQWFAPDGRPAWGSRRKRVIGSIGSVRALIRRRMMASLRARALVGGEK